MQKKIQAILNFFVKNIHKLFYTFKQPSNVDINFRKYINKKILIFIIKEISVLYIFNCDFNSSVFLICFFFFFKSCKRFNKPLANRKSCKRRSQRCKYVQWVQC